jgi:hypothetical protein
MRDDTRSVDARNGGQLLMADVSWLERSAADAALEASCRALRIFKEKLHEVEQRIASRPSNG